MLTISVVSPLIAKLDWSYLCRPTFPAEGSASKSKNDIYFKWELKRFEDAVENSYSFKIIAAVHSQIVVESRLYKEYPTSRKNNAKFCLLNRPFVKGSSTNSCLSKVRITFLRSSVEPQPLFIPNQLTLQENTNMGMDWSIQALSNIGCNFDCLHMTEPGFSTHPLSQTTIRCDSVCR